MTFMEVWGTHTISIYQYGIRATSTIILPSPVRAARMRYTVGYLDRGHCMRPLPWTIAPPRAT